MEQITLSDLPQWLTEHYEKEYGECFIFYKKGNEDFTQDQYLELNAKGYNYYRVPDTIGLTGKAKGYEIKLYKTVSDFENVGFQFKGYQSGIRISKKR